MNPDSSYIWFMRRRALMFILPICLMLWMATQIEGKMGEFLMWWDTTIIGVIIYFTIRNEYVIAKWEKILGIYPLTVRHAALLIRMKNDKNFRGNPD